MSPSGVPDLATTRPVPRQVRRRLHPAADLTLPPIPNKPSPPTPTLPPTTPKMPSIVPPRYPPATIPTLPPPPPSPVSTPPPPYTSSRGLFWPPESLNLSHTYHS